MPTPTIDPVYEGMRDYLNQQWMNNVIEGLPGLLSAIAFSLFIIALAAVLIFRNRKAIKRFFDL